MLGFMMDAFYTSSSFPTLNWYGSYKSPLNHIYCSYMSDDYFIAQIYDLCDLFLGSMYFKIFKFDAPTFSQGSRELISVYGRWYAGEFFSYIRIWGSNTVHLLPRIVLDHMVLQ